MNKSTTKLILGLVITLVVFNFIVLPSFRNAASSVEQQSIAQIPYIDHSEIFCSEAALIYRIGNSFLAYSKTETDKLLWKTHIPSMGQVSKIKVEANAIFVIDKGLLLYVIDTNTGQQITTFNLPFYYFKYLELDISEDYAIVKYNKTDETVFYTVANWKKKVLVEPISEVQLSAPDEVISRIKQQQKWSEMVYFKSLKIFWDENEKCLMPLNQMDYISELSAFVFNRIADFSFMRINETQATFKSQWLSIPSTATFHHFSENYLFFLNSGSVNVDLSDVFFMPYKDGKFSRFYSKEVKRSVPFSFHLRNGCIGLAYSNEIELFQPKNYSYSKNRNQFYPIGQEKKLHLENGTQLNDFFIDDSNLYVLSDKKKDFEGKGTTYFFYVLPLDYADQ